jgi:Ca-activated chloride channel homolog
VTALYEIVPAGVAPPGAEVDALKYQRRPSSTRAGGDAEMMTIKLRYKQPDAGRSRRIESTVKVDAKPLGPNLGFASSVAELGMLLRESEHRGSASVEQVVGRARRFRGPDPNNERGEFVALAERAVLLLPQLTSERPR